MTDSKGVCDAHSAQFSDVGVLHGPNNPGGNLKMIEKCHELDHSPLFHIPCLFPFSFYSRIFSFPYVHLRFSTSRLKSSKLSRNRKCFLTNAFLGKSLILWFPPLFWNVTLPSRLYCRAYIYSLFQDCHALSYVFFTASIFISTILL